MERIMQILEYIPPVLREPIAAVCGLPNVEEIRFRANKPIAIFADGKSRIIAETVATVTDLNAIFTAVCEHSVYAYLEEIKQGFITVKGGHRVGICGRAIANNGNIENIKDISGINFRIAREVIGCADEIFGEVVGANCVRPYSADENAGAVIDRPITQTEFVADGRADPAPTINSTLIISPPQCGKTTILRDLTRQISNLGKNVSVVDCRGEIAATYRGVAQNDLGANADVLDGTPKAAGMMMLLRSMSPQVLITDEIATVDDVLAVSQALSGGVSVVASVHGRRIEDILENPKFAPLFGVCGFAKIVLLSRKNGAGTVEEVRTL